jgi:hypothetical protein
LRYFSLPKSNTIFISNLVYISNNLGVKNILKFERTGYDYDVSNMSMIVNHGDKEKRPFATKHEGTSDSGRSVQT